MEGSVPGFRFGPFELKRRTRELYKHGIKIKLRPQPFQVLCLLLDHAGDVVTREELRQQLWPSDTFVDFEHSLNTAVKELRGVLDDSATEPRYIQTLPRLGYRFMVTVEVSPPPVDQDSARVQAAVVESMIGKRVSHYRILQVLGGGGMGLVYMAEDLKLGRRVAMKFLPGELARDSRAFERFEREARAASALEHPNICSIYQLGEHDCQPFIVMPLLEGQTLREWIESTAGHSLASRMEELLDLVIQIAEGLEAAHQRGIIHRDIKPANVFITSRREAKILDFGVAKFVSGNEPPGAVSPPGGDFVPAAESPVGLNTRLTRTDSSMGTPSYLSPEQIRGDTLDPRTDLFSLGLVLYEMATGRQAFSGNTATLIRDAVLHLATVPPRQANPAIPAELETIINKSLEKEPNRRYQSARELRLDLERLRNQARPLASSRRATWVWISASAAIVLLVLIGTNIGGVRQRVFHRTQAVQSGNAFKARPSIAVLGFKNLSGKEDEAWISTALAEMLGAELAVGQLVRVVPGENVARMKADLSLAPANSYDQDTLKKIRNHLNTDMVVLGSYLALGRESEGKIRVDLELQDTMAGETVAVISKQGTEGGLAELASLSGADLRQKLRIGAVTGRDMEGVRALIPASPETARLYVEGLDKLRRFDALAARDLFTKAIAADPRHALSHSALAESWSALGYDGKAQEEAKIALDLSGGLPREERLSIEGRYREFAHDFAAAIEIYRTLRNFFYDDLDYGLRLANAQLKADRGRDALETIGQMRGLPPPASNDARIDLMEANTGDSLGDFKRAQRMGAAAAEKAELQGNRLLLAQAKEREGWAWDSLGDFEKAMTRLSEARELFASSGNPRSSAIVLLDIGDVSMDKGDFAGARKSYDEALRIFRQTGAQQKTAVALSRLGSLSLYQGKLQEAKQYQGAALRLDLEIGSATARDLSNLANVLEALGDLAGATEMGQQSVQAYRQGGDRSSEAVSLSNLGDVLLKRGEIGSAKANVEQAIELEQEMSYRRPLGFSLLLMAQILRAQDRLEDAQATVKRSIALRKELKDETRIRECEMELAKIALEQGKLLEAESLARYAAAAFDEQKMADLGTESYADLAHALLAQGKDRDAQEAAEHALALSQATTDRPSRFLAAIASAEVNAEFGRTDEAVKTLESVDADTSRYGYVSLELESRLRLAELELRSGRTTSGWARLQKLQSDARDKGFLLIARKARADLSGKSLHR